MRKTQAITEGAILLALFLVLLLVSTYLPIVGPIFLLFLPLPFILFTIRHQLSLVVLLIFAGCILSILFGPITNLLVALTSGLSGLVMGIFYKKKQTMSAIIGGSLAFTASLVITYIGSIFFLQIDIVKDSFTLLEQSMDQSRSILSSFSEPEEVDKQFEQLDEGIEFLGMLIPTLFIIMGFLSTLAIHFVSLPILKRLRVDVKSLIPFREWRLPQSLIWYYLITTILILMNIDRDSFVFLAAINLNVFLQFLLLLQGFSFIFYFCYQKGYSKAIPIVVFFVSMLLPMVLYLIRILGIIDLGFPLRGKITKR
ncbi:YybS family protein [Bacillus weihaiensis]|uniref:YybS family protein n=1 Tax=Bacillus weihaiensis TaxID=1547283 RepID=UPI002355C920|nr:YybS family protein [Bacillus weihaiensis]